MSGSGPSRPVPVVAVPGTLCSPAVFDALAATLGDGFDVEPVDWLTGSGPWTVPAVADRIGDAVAAAGRRPVLLIGHSTGGAVALWLATERPELVAGLVAVGTGAHMRGHGDVDAIIERVRTAWGPELRQAVLDRSFATPPTAEFAAVLRDYAAGVTPEAVAQVLASQRDLDLEPRLAALTMPVTVVHGRHDPTRPVERAAELAAAVGDGELVVLGTGHTPVHESPGQVAAAVRALAVRAGLRPAG
ncbi:MULTISPECIES: alpha/beta fold hydrolase [unclassified Pseudonocardia]|uniref:alpha/beta fold hydrolase n=1 Tax=unclassified Pseudonocardia TaxID=2619320 RepID=UPI000A429F05|nr:MULTISPECIES: alpha/beta hydrolase [unclassified Pseudonocardia]